MPSELICQKRTFALAAPGANTNFYATYLTPQYPVSAFRITVVLAVASVLNMMIKKGATEYTCGLNSSAALNAGDLYTFIVGVNLDNTYNFQVESDGIIRVLQVDELPGVVA